MTFLYHGYSVLLSTFALKFVAIGSFNSSGLYLGPLSQSFPECNGGFLALYCTIQIVAGLASSFVGGIAQEAFDLRGIRLQWLFFFGGLFMALGLFVSSYSYTVMMLLLGSLVTGIGLGLCGFLAGGVCVLWFEASRGTMLLLAMSGEGIGNIFFSWLTANLLEIFGSPSSAASNDTDNDDAWRLAMRCVGVISLIISSVASISIRLPTAGEVEEHERKNRLNMDETEAVMLAWESDNYGAASGDKGSKSKSNVDHSHHHVHINMKQTRASIIEKERRSSLTMLATYEALGDAHLMPRPSPCRSKKRWKAAVSTVVASLKFGETVGCVSEDIVSDNDEINGESLSLGEVSLSSTNFWLSAFSLISCFSILNLQVLLASYTSFIGMQPSDGGRILSMCGVGILFSNLSLGPVADRIGSRQLLTVSFFGISVLFFIWPRCISTASLSALAFCYGYLCCTMSSLPVIILADAYESFPQRVLALNGITNIFKFPGYLFGPLIAGMLVEKKGYGFAGFVSGLTTLAGSLTLFMVPSADKQHRELLEFKRNKLSK